MVVSVKEKAWDEAEADLQKAIIMKLSGPKAYKLQEFVTTMRKAWGTEEFIIKEVANSLLVAIFEKEEGMKRVLEEGPWSFKGSILIMERWRRGGTPEMMKLDKLQAWVQIHNIPFVIRDTGMARAIAELAGRVVKSMHMDEEAQKIRFHRFKVEIDVLKPLRGGCYLKTREGNYFWLEIRYERLPIHCQRCGTLVHDARRCVELQEEKGGGRWVKVDDGTLQLIEVEEDYSLQLEDTPGMAPTPMAAPLKPISAKQHEDSTNELAFCTDNAGKTGGGPLADTRKIGATMRKTEGSVGENNAQRGEEKGKEKVQTN